MNIANYKNLLRCPDCQQGSLAIQEQETFLICQHCRATFPVAGHKSILLAHNNSLFNIDSYLSFAKPKTSNDFSKFMPSPSVNLVSSNVISTLKSMLDIRGPSNILVVGGGKQRAWLDPLLSSVPSHHIVYSDIDIHADVDLFADAHNLPFIDAAFDAVITTAVLEHLLYPEKAASEIERVTKIGGLLYSEIPFMQQVHEGAYDFTRYTLSGHRRLFNGYNEIKSGMVAGPATSLVWAIENFALAFIRHARLRKIVKVSMRISFFWLKYFDYYLASRPEAMDGSSCTYFLGTKTQERISDQEIIARYVGAKHLQHV